MTPDAARELWVRYVSGEALPAADQAALVAALDADPALRAELLEDVQFDGTLRAMGDARRSGAAFAAEVAACLEPERDATRFVRKVEARLADLPPEPAGAGRDSRSNLPRISRRFHRRDSASTGWKSALAAACALFALLLLSTVLSSKPARSKPAPDVVRETPAPEPEPKAPEDLRTTRRLVEIEREKKSLEASPSLPPKEEEDRQGKLARLEAERERIEAEMREAIGKTAPAPAKDVEAPASVPGTTRPEGVVLSVLERAVVERIEGNAYLGKPTSFVRAKKGMALEPGQDLWTLAGGLAVLRYPDRTRVEVRASTTVRDESEVRSRRFFLVQGEVISEIAKQPADRPMIFATERAEALVLGTTLRLVADATGTLLEVKEGRVRLKRLPDGAAAEVGAGQVATTADLSAQVAFPDAFTMNFGPADTKLKDGDLNDSGETFDPKRGYGWDGPKVGEVIATWVDGQGRPQPKRQGREAVRRGDPALVGPYKATDIVAGWGAHSETWRIKLPNGHYLVTVCVGDPTFEQGPHHVSLEGVQVIDRVKTRQPKFFHEKDFPVEVKDGELTMVVGGYPGNRDSVDASKDTILNFVTIKRVPSRGK